MNEKHRLATLIDSVIDKRLPFACWFLPGEEIPRLILCPSATKSAPLLPDLGQARGFVLAPFAASAATPTVLLEPEILLQGYRQICAYDPAALPRKKAVQERGHGHDTPFPAYITCLDQALERIAAGEFSKVVLSRCLTKERRKESCGRLFLAMKECNPQVFVSVVYTPQSGLWMGASPETLLEIDGEEATTVSLAGTQPLRSDGRYCWFAKEIEEQAFVSRYAVDILNRYGVECYSTRGPEDLETAAVAHLKTTFTFPLAAISSRLERFVTELSPTPAVCGLPKESARQFILDHEPHNRRYYSGFLGPWQLEECPTHLFVNLRCMAVEEDHYTLYTGGGITALSSPKEEWQETSNKARTLLAVIERMQEATP